MGRNYYRCDTIPIKRDFSITVLLAAPSKYKERVVLSNIQLIREYVSIPFVD